MSEPIQEQIKVIDEERNAAMELVAKTIQPLARVVCLLLQTRGTDVGWIKKHKEFGFGGVLISRVGSRWSNEIEVFYDGQLVLHFNDYLAWISHIDRGDKRKYLFFYKGGEWQQAVVDEYRLSATANLHQNFDVGGE